MGAISKDEVLDWYQGLAASNRLEIICSLLDYSLPFELRFLGTVIEHLGRKDFHMLRDAENKANSLHSVTAAAVVAAAAAADPPPVPVVPRERDTSSILRLLSEGPQGGGGGGGTLTSSGGKGDRGVSPKQQQQQGGQPTTSTSTTTTTTKTTGDKVSRVKAETVENGVSSSSTSTSSSPRPSSKEGAKVVGEEGGIPELSTNHYHHFPHPHIQHPLILPLNHHHNHHHHHDDEVTRESWLHDGVKRRKLILYLSLMSATNHDSANLYYLLLSDVEDWLEGMDWFWDLHEAVQEEIVLLYSIGSHHPAFNFEQRTFLAAVVGRLKDALTNKVVEEVPTPTMTMPPQQQSQSQNQYQGANNQQQQQYLVQLNWLNWNPALPGQYHHQQHQAHPHPYYTLPSFSLAQQVVNQQQQQHNHQHVVPHSHNNFKPYNVVNNPPPILPNHVKDNNMPKGMGGAVGDNNAHLPLTSPHSRSLTGDLNLTPTGVEYPPPSALENSTMPALEDPVYVTCRPRKISCYNCGSNTHSGPECREASMEEMTKMQYRLNFGGDAAGGSSSSHFRVQN